MRHSDNTQPVASPLVVAHRGDVAGHPENSLAAIQSAADNGIHFIEFDIQLCADECPVIFHDDTLTRMTDGEGSIFGTSSETLLNYHLRQFEQGPHTTLHPSRLSDLVSAFRARPEITFFAEIKEESVDYFGLEKTFQLVTDVLQPLQSQVVIISFDYGICQASQAAGWQHGWVIREYAQTTLDAAKRAACKWLFCNHKRLPKAPVQLWQDDFKWAIYEVTDRALAMSLFQQGAHAVESMQPIQLADQLQKVNREE